MGSYCIELAFESYYFAVFMTFQQQLMGTSETESVKIAGNDSGLMTNSQSSQVRASALVTALDSSSDQHDKEGLIELLTSTGS